MKIKTLLLALFAICSVAAYGQTNQATQAFGIGVELNAPSSSTYVIGVGFSGKLEFPIASPVNLTVTAGYNAMFRELGLTPIPALFSRYLQVQAMC